MTDTSVVDESLTPTTSEPKPLFSISTTYEAYVFLRIVGKALPSESFNSDHATAVPSSPFALTGVTVKPVESPLTLNATFAAGVASALETL